MHADMREPVIRAARLHMRGIDAGELPPEPLLDGVEESLEAPIIENVFETRLGAIGAIAAIDEDMADRVRDFHGVARLQDDSSVAGEILVAGDPAKRKAVIDTGLNRCAVADFHRLEADVVRVFERVDDAGAVEGNVELTRQAVKRARVEDVIVPGPRIGARVVELAGIDAGSGRPGHVADIVGAGAFGDDADRGKTLDDRRPALRRNFAQLQIGARRHMRIAAGEFFRHVGNRRELPMFDDAVRDAQPAHVTRLRRRHVKQAVIAPAEIIFRLRRSAGERLLAHARISVERMLGALPFFLIDELLALGDDALLGTQRIGVRSARLGRCGRRRSALRSAWLRKPGKAADRRGPRRKALEPALLLR